MTTRFRSFCNFLLMIGVCIPPAVFVLNLRQHCPSSAPTEDFSMTELLRRWFESAPSGFTAAPAPILCETYRSYPNLCVNLLYFVVVDVGFYVIYLCQGSTWLIDPHWQLIPVCIAFFFFTHPDASGVAATRHPRSWLLLGGILTWAARLMHNYLRREEWQFGGREDWRYADMRQAHGRWWMVSQFGAVCLAQHAMLVGLTLPLAPAMSADGAALNAVDVIACTLCAAGIAIGYVADKQLHTYMQFDRSKKPLVLDTGLWRYSRHPNHFGEQCWWIGVLLLGLSSHSHSHYIAFGVLFNHPLDTFVTLRLIEDRMLRRPERVRAFRAYQERTSLLVPWFPSGSKKN